MKKIVRESLNEKVTFSEKVDDIFRDTVSKLRSDVFPKLNEDELEHFMFKLRDWTLDMLGETVENPKKRDWTDEPQKDWGGPRSTDTKPGWGEMGG